jgi:hypothetical protein
MANRECDGSCGGHQENLGTGCFADRTDNTVPTCVGCGGSSDGSHLKGCVVANRADNTAKPISDDNIFPWRDLYPLAGQRVLYDGEEWMVLKAEKGGSFRKLWRDTKDGKEFTATVDRMECRPLTWTLLDELIVELQGYTDAFAPGATIILAWPETEH